MPCDTPRGTENTQDGATASNNSEMTQKKLVKTGLLKESLELDTNGSWQEPDRL